MYQQKYNEYIHAFAICRYQEEIHEFLAVNENGAYEIDLIKQQESTISLRKQGKNELLM